MSIINANIAPMRVCWIFGVPALFTPYRVSRQTVHFGLYQYDMQALLDSPNEVFVLAEQAEDLFYGTILTTQKIELPRGSRIVPDGAFSMESRYCRRKKALGQRTGNRYGAPFFSLDVPAARNMVCAGA